AGSASLVQRPTDARDELIDAIDRLQLQRATATGSGLLVALATIFPDHEIDVETRVLGPRTVRDHARGAMPQRPVAKPFDPVAPGSYGSAVIVLLSDGRRTTGPDPLEVAKMAADRGVRVYTVGFGTLDGASSGFDGFSIYMRLDEPTLKAIAEITRGEYFHATSATELRKIYETLSSRLVVEKESTEVSGMIAAFAALLMALAGLLSLRWFSRLA
ncbi:MAG TPA: VWA domain-containing protein, partial [Burkholderiaceae bacterium]|nr:VWA domain-containing protein [Burkholderiaceae bacterium]